MRLEVGWGWVYDLGSVWDDVGAYKTVLGFDLALGWTGLEEPFLTQGGSCLP